MHATNKVQALKKRSERESSGQGSGPLSVPRFERQEPLYLDNPDEENWIAIPQQWHWHL